jgi:hypothetical protein
MMKVNRKQKRQMIIIKILMVILIIKIITRIFLKPGRRASMAINVAARAIMAGYAYSNKI